MSAVHVLGLDGMPSEGLFELVDAGYLPRGRALIEASATEVLNSTVPSYTIPGWTSAFTGVPPADHGLLWWRRREPDLPWRTADLPGFASIDEARRPPVWRIADAAGVNTAVLFVPATYPAPRLRTGIAVSGFLAPWPSRHAVWPESLYDVAREWNPSDVSDPDDGPERTSARSTIERVIRAESQRFDLWRRALNERDLTISVLVGPDRLSHAAWSHFIPAMSRDDDVDRAARAYWSLVDGWLAELSDARDRGDSIILCSDHGSAAPPTSVVSVRPLLATLGFRDTRRWVRLLPRAAYPVALRAKARFGPLARAIVPRVSAASVGMPSEAARCIDVSWGDRDVGFFVASNIPERDETIRELVTSLAGVSDGTGRIFDDVAVARKFLGGDARADLPDVIAITRADVRSTPGGAFDQVTRATQSDRGMHKREGVVAVAADGTSIEAPASVEDIAVTILALLGISAPPWMTGKPLVARRHLVTADLGQGAVTRVDESVSPAELDEIERQLRGLGYVE